MTAKTDEEEPPHSPRHCRDYLAALSKHPKGVPADRMANMREIRNRVNRDFLVDNGLCEFREIDGEKRFFITDKGLEAHESEAELL